MLKNSTLLLACLFGCLFSAQSQVILDFETPATSTTFQYFGSTLDPTLTKTVANPAPAGVNTSATVLEFKEPTGAEVWAGCFSTPNPTTPLNLISGGLIKIKFWTDHPGNLVIKLEEGENNAPNWALKVDNAVINQWVELTFDPSLPSFEAPNAVGKGNIYKKVVLFADFGNVPSGDKTYYIDDIRVVAAPPASCTTLLDFEAPATSTAFQYFGSTIDGTLSATVANPAPAGVNTSATVLEFKEPTGAQVWAGAFSMPNPTASINFISGSLIKIKFWTDHPGNLVVKLEEGENNAPNWALKVDNAVVNQWVELTFDASLPSFEAPNAPAKGNIYKKIVLFADFGNVPTADKTYYIDDFQVCTAGASAPVEVTFRLDMNQYSGAAFSKAYVSGSFNAWAGDANELLDADGDKIYEGKIAVPVGLYEYKFTLDNFAQQELFPTTSACTKTTIDGANVFTNRKLLVSQATTVGPVCFNSCYTCGGSVKLDFNIGMNGIAPDPGGVFLAGGLDFGAPGGHFKMTDADGDGIFSIRVERQKGYSTYYAFANGPCSDYSCKEDISGLPCAIAANFNDRWLPAATKDTVINTCYKTCATNTNCTTRADDLEFSSDWMTVQPTLVVDAVRLVFSTPIIGKADIRIFDAAGKLAFFGQKSDVSEVILPVEGLPSGLFFVFVNAEKRAATGRFVKI